jgi:hypothetical protein
MKEIYKREDFDPRMRFFAERPDMSGRVTEQV